MKTHATVYLLAILTCTPDLAFCEPAGTAFTYQGRLSDAGVPATGSYDLKFTLLDSEFRGNQIGVSLTNSPVEISNGLFTAVLDFGPDVFDGYARWLEIGVRPWGGGDFTTLSRRQRVTPVPYAISASTVAGPVSANQVVGSLGAVSLPTGGNWALNSTLTFDSDTLTIDPALKRVGIGTSAPGAPLTIRPSGTFYGLEHTDGTRRLSTYLSDIGCWFGSVSPNSLHFFVNDGPPCMTINLAGNVGIGTTTPEYALDLAGGAARAGVFLFNSPRQHVMTIGAAAFQVGTVSYATNGFTEVHDPESFSGATVSYSKDMFAPVSLPHGATITQVTFWVYRSSAGGMQPEVELRRVRHDGTVTNTIASSYPLGFTSGIVSRTASSVTDGLVDNVNFQYYLKAFYLAGEGVRAVVIRYTTTEAD